MDVIRQRHSVRQYTDKPIDATVVSVLNAMITSINTESGLHVQLLTDEPVAFSVGLAHYGKFSGVRNYIALVGRKTDNLDSLAGYWGEHLVLKAQEVGLNTCWVGLTYKQNREIVKVDKGERIVAVIAIGYGVNRGIPHKSKSREDVMSVEGTVPDWFIRGIDAALLAPTALNQQRFKFILDGNTVEAKAGIGFFSKVDLGIVRYHFELGAGTENFVWK